MPIYDTPQEAFDELARRIALLSKAGSLYRGLNFRLGTSQTIKMRSLASRRKQHQPYAEAIDLTPVEDAEFGNFHVGVSDAQENAAKAAEFGTQKNRQDPLWFPMLRMSKRESKVFARALLRAIAREVAKGEGLKERLLIENSPLIPSGETGIAGVDEQAERYQELITLEDL